MVKLTIKSQDGKLELAFPDDYTIDVSRISDEGAVQTFSIPSSDIKLKQDGTPDLRCSNAVSEANSANYWNVMNEKYIKYVREGGQLQFKAWRKQYNSSGPIKLNLPEMWREYIRKGGNMMYTEWNEARKRGEV